MWRRMFLVVLASVPLVALVSGVNADDDKGVEQAKKTVSEFGTKLAANDLDGVLKTLDAPFVWNFANEGKLEVIKDRDGLKKPVQSLLDRFKDKKPKLEVTRVISSADFIEAVSKDVSKEDGKLLDDVLKKDGYVLQVEVKGGDGKRITIWACLVASPSGQPKVVGVLDK
jgi:hypothetical protein